MLKNDINIPLLTTIGTISSMLLIVILLGVEAWYRWEVKTERDAQWGTAVNAQVVKLKSSQQATLMAPPKHADPAKGTVHVPINQAMELVVKNGGKLPK